MRVDSAITTGVAIRLLEHVDNALDVALKETRGFKTSDAVIREDGESVGTKMGAEGDISSPPRFTDSKRFHVLVRGVMGLLC